MSESPTPGSTQEAVLEGAEPCSVIHNCWKLHREKHKEKAKRALEDTAHPPTPTGVLVVARRTSKFFSRTHVAEERYDHVHQG